MKKSKIVQAIVHVVIIVFLILFPYLLEFRRINDFQRLIFNPFAIRYLMSFGLLVGFVYLNYLLLVHKYYFKRKFVSYGLWLFGSLWTILYLPEIAAYQLDIKTPSQKNISSDKRDFWDRIKWSSPEEPNHKRHDPPLGFRDAPPAFGDRPPTSPRINVIIFFFVSAFLTIAVLTDKRLQQIENEKLTAELAQLKAQVNPHFLFNTLNNIYALVMRKDEKAGDSVLKLSEMMRYILKETENTHVPLSKEIAFIHSYMDLQKHRLTHNMQLNYSCNFHRKI